MQHLINSIAQVKEFVNVGLGLSMDTLRPSLNAVEMQELTFYLGADLLAEIVEQVNSEPQVFTPRIAKIARFVVSANANLAVYKAGPELEVHVSDNGILRNETDREKTAFGGQVKRFLELAADRGYQSIDAFLKLLETYSQDYPEWLGSEYYSQRDGLLIKSAQEFEAAGEAIKGSALTFLAFRPIIKDIQAQRIAQAVPEVMLADLLANPNTAPNKFILANYIRPAIAKLTVQEALSSLPIAIDNDSVIVNQLASGDGRTKSTAPLDLIEKKAWGLRGRGEYYLSLMKEFLNQNASDTVYPLWFASDYYSETLRAQIERESLPKHERRIYRA